MDKFLRVIFSILVIGLFSLIQTRDGFLSFETTAFFSQSARRVRGPSDSLTRLRGIPHL